MKRSKAYRKAAELLEEGRIYSPLEAANLAKQASPTKFDGTVEVAMRLGVDPRKADQMVRGTVSLPHGTGKAVRVIVFATGDKAEEARTAGADKVGKMTKAQVRDIAQTKMTDLNATTIEAAEQIIAGTARSMGITVEG